MVKKLNFASLESKIEKVSEQRQGRWASREPNPTVQMSIRMRADLYDRFRALCAEERRTNGEMLEQLLEDYFERARAAAADLEKK